MKVDENGGIICDIDDIFSNRHNNGHEQALITCKNAQDGLE
jgi:hypothetical protein